MWPQITVLVVLLIQCGWAIRQAVRDTKFTSEQATIMVLVYLAYAGGYAAVLHADGFW